MKKYCVLLALLSTSMHAAVPSPEAKIKESRSLAALANELGILDENGKCKPGLFNIQSPHHYKELDEIIQNLDKKDELDKEKKAQIEAQAREISQTLKVWDETGKNLDPEITAAYQNILYNTLIGDNSWINQLEIQRACNIARTLLKCEGLKNVAAAPLILLANELAEKGHCLVEFLPLCLQELDKEDEIIHAVAAELMSQFVSNNIGVEELARIAQTERESGDSSIQKRALIAYYPLSLNKAYQAEAIEAALKGIKSSNKKIRLCAIEIFTNLILKKIPLSPNIASFLINYKKAIFRVLFAVQGRYLDICFEMLNAKQSNRKLDIEELPTLIYLLLNNYKVDSVKALGRAALAKYKSWKDKHQRIDDNWLDIDVFLELFDIEFLVNQDYKHWVKARTVCDENDKCLLDHINVTNCLNALFNKDSKCSSEEQVNVFIDEIRSAYVKMGVGQNLTSNLFAKFYNK